MSFDKQGFLSPDLDAWRAAVRARYPKHFELLSEINEAAQACLGDLAKLPPRPDDDHRGRLLSVALWVRQLQQFQGAVVNLERGMVTNARTLLRSGFETLFFVAGSLWVPAFFRIAQCDYKYQQDRVIRMHIKALKDEPNYESNPESKASVARLEKTLAAHHEQTKEYESKAAGFENIARMTGMDLAYDAHYRELSTDSVHVNVWSLMSHFDPKDGGVVIGPGVGDYKDTLDVTIVLGGYMLEIVNRVLKSEKLTALYRRMVDEVVVLMPPPVLSDL
jgi:hypothetical protein